MLANIEKVRREDQAAQIAKKNRVKIMNEEIKIANVQALHQKEAARQTEKTDWPETARMQITGGPRASR